MASILAFGYHDQQAQRHWSMCKQLQAEAHTILECHTNKAGLFGKYWSLFHQYIRAQKKIDTVLVTFPGQYLMPLAWLLTRYPRKKLVLDAFISLWDTLVDDRKKYSRLSPMALFLYCVDYLSCHLADEVLIDTEAHRQFFIKTFKLNPKKVRVVYLGTREDIFYPRKTVIQNSTFEILFFGTYIPLQGIEHIVSAAGILQSIAPNIHFTLIGSGQTRKEIEELIARKNITNMTLENRIPMAQLADRIRDCDVCLGIFGTSGKASRVIPHKVYDALSCGVPVVTADTPAIHEKFTDGKEVFLCPAGNPAALAEKIMEIKGTLHA